jgi:hypothetical protein
MIEPLTHRTDLGHDLELVILILVVVLLIVAILYYARRV